MHGSRFNYCFHSASINIPQLKLYIPNPVPRFMLEQLILLAQVLSVFSGMSRAITMAMKLEHGNRTISAAFPYFLQGDADVPAFRHVASRRPSACNRVGQPDLGVIYCGLASGLTLFGCALFLGQCAPGS